MAKMLLSSTHAFDIRQALHVAVLDALVSSRRWAPGDLAFQGGTSLHLVHGSPRYSEDLDFLVNSSLKLNTLSQTVAARLQSISWLPKVTRLTVSVAKEGRSLHAFVVSVGGENVIGSVRVKVELWKTAPDVLAKLHVVVSPVRLVSGPAAGMQTFVPTSSLKEIYADKVFALAARPYLKPRDVFDLHWLNAQSAHTEPQECSEADLRSRLATYPEETAAAWLVKARARLADLHAGGNRVATDLRRWLPSSWPLSDSDAAVMVQTSAQALLKGMDVMQRIAQGDEYHDTDVGDEVCDAGDQPCLPGNQPAP